MTDGNAEFSADDLRKWLRLGPSPADVQVTVDDVVVEEKFERRRIDYTAADGDRIHAFLLVPTTRHSGAAVMIHHQHNGERHLGKSEVCGLAGDPLQAFGPVLAERGFVVLAPDSICFEDRRANGKGVEPHPGDWDQHYNEMAYRLVRGDTLMRKVLDDAAAGISVLAELTGVDPDRIGVLGHSYGGNTVLFQTAVDDRVRFACSSGAVCSYEKRIERGTGIEMAEVIPGVVGRLEVDDLLRLAAPRPMLVVSGTDDPYSYDAADMVRLARRSHPALEHAQFDGGHAVTSERFDRIVEWVAHAGLDETRILQAHR